MGRNVAHLCGHIRITSTTFLKLGICSAINLYENFIFLFLASNYFQNLEMYPNSNTVYQNLFFLPNSIFPSFRRAQNTQSLGKVQLLNILGSEKETDPSEYKNF